MLFAVVFVFGWFLVQWMSKSDDGSWYECNIDQAKWPGATCSMADTCPRCKHVKVGE